MESSAYIYFHIDVISELYKISAFTFVYADDDRSCNNIFSIIGDAEVGQPAPNRAKDLIQGFKHYFNLWQGAYVLLFVAYLFYSPGGFDSSSTYGL